MFQFRNLEISLLNFKFLDELKARDQPEDARLEKMSGTILEFTAIDVVYQTVF